MPRVIHVVQDRLSLTPENQARLLEALEAAFTLGKGHATVQGAESGGVSRPFSTSWTNPRTGFTLRPPTAALFSFNSPLGACPKCRGFGRIIGIDLDKAIPDKSLSIAEGAIKPFQGERGDECQRDLVKGCRERGIDIKCPVEDLSEDELEWIYYGDRRSDNLTPEELEEIWQSGEWYGIKGFFDWMETKAYKMHVPAPVVLRTEVGDRHPSVRLHAGPRRERDLLTAELPRPGGARVSNTGPDDPDTFRRRGGAGESDHLSGCRADRNAFRSR
ncbi:MAG: hypothetical protein EOP85_23885 [Verrucomicrobiaceae bacterium]|nr:MAG: hypothetical protein EOP85_23885 [Verrucomicrobiaceae bacterium]